MVAMVMATRMIEARGVSKSFGSKRAVDDLGLHVDRSEVVGLLGPNGSGKTTMVRLLNGVLRADRGSIQVGGLDPVEHGAKVRSASGVLTESADFYRNMTARDNLRFFARLYPDVAGDRPAELLAQVGLAADAERLVGTFSTGMRKRLGLARALLHRPAVLFLDEPTSGLDPGGSRAVLDLIGETRRNEGATILICSHLLKQLEPVCDRYVFIDDGRLVDEGTLSELAARHRRDADLVLQVDTNLEAEGEFAGHAFSAESLEPGLRRLAFGLPRRDAVPALLRAIVADADVYRAEVLEPDLEALYFRIMNRGES